MPTLTETQKQVKLLVDTGAVFGASGKRLVMEKTTDGRIFLRGELGHTDVPTSNNRVYTKEVIEREISKLQKEAKGNKLYGELDHPCIINSEFSVLTVDGWKPFREIKVGDKVWSRKNGKAVESVVEGIVNEPYDGSAYNVKGRSIDSGFTPGHRFLFVKRSDSKDLAEQYRTVEDVSSNLPSLRHCRIPKCAEWEADYVSEVTIQGMKIDSRVQHFDHDVEQDLKIDAQLFSAFMGVYLSEGYCSSETSENYGIHISQKNDWSRNFIWDQVLSLFPEDLKWHQEKTGFYLSDARLYQYLKKLGDVYHKYVPQEIKSLNSACLKEFLFWFGVGDGRMVSTCSSEAKDNWNSPAEGWRETGRTFKETAAAALREKTIPFTRRDVFSVSKQLITDLHECLVKSGGCGTLSEIVTDEDYEFAGRTIKAESKKPLYQLHISQSDGIYLDPRFLKIEKVYHKGNIYCLSVTHGNFYMEQNGKSFWTGNSDGRTQFQRVSHIIRDLHVAPNGAIVGELELLGTARGNDLAAIIKAGGAVGVSSRGTGTTHKREDGVDVVNDDYTLITYDVVADPAHSGAYPDVFFEWNEAKNLGRVEMSDSEKDVKDVAAPASEPAAQPAAPAADAPAEKPEGEMITVEACSAQTADAVQKAMEGMREQVRAEEREAIKEQVQKELTSQVESMKKEALESARSEILSDPKVADAKNRLAAIRSILGSSDESLVPKEENDKLAATLKERDEQIAALSAKVSEFEKKITEANAEKAKLAETARRSFVKSYVEKRISDLPDKELVREFIMKSLAEQDDAKTIEKKVDEAVGKFKKAIESKQERLTAISAQIREEVKTQTDKMQAEIASLRDENKRLAEQNGKLKDLTKTATDAAREGLRAAQFESKVAGRPDRAKLMKLFESSNPTDIDKFIAEATAGTKDSELLKQVQEGVKRGSGRMTNPDGSAPKSILSEGRNEQQPTLYGVNLNVMRKLAGVKDPA
jgi:hypothetical protein